MLDDSTPISSEEIDGILIPSLPTESERYLWVPDGQGRIAILTKQERQRIIGHPLVGFSFLSERDEEIRLTIAAPDRWWFEDWKGIPKKHYEKTFKSLAGHPNTKFLVVGSMVMAQENGQSLRAVLINEIMPLSQRSGGGW